MLASTNIVHYSPSQVTYYANDNSLPSLHQLVFLKRINERADCPTCKSACHYPTSLTRIQADPQGCLLSIAGSFDGSSSVLVINNGSVISSTPSVAFRSKMHTVDSPELKWAISNTLASALDQASITDKPCPTKLVEIAYRSMKDVKGQVQCSE